LPKVCQGEKGQAVQEVEPRHLLRLGDGGEIHHLVFLQERLAKGAHRFHRPPGQGQPQARQTSLQGFQHPTHV